jgi:general stress protein YciG
MAKKPERRPEGQSGEMSVREAGRKGGERTAETHGPEFYSEIGQKGGEKGGEVTKQKYGPEFYSEIGHKGGQKVKELIERGRKKGGPSSP